MYIDQILDNIYPIPSLSKQDIKDYIHEVNFPKGHLLLRSDKVEHKVYFIKKGIVRAFVPNPKEDLTFWFGEEGEAILSMTNYVEGKKSYEDIELLEDCELYEISITDLHNLFKKDIHLANFGRVLAEKELLKMERRWISSQLKSAKERYDDLMQYYPSLFQRVPLKMIATYLGITPVSLSRIRKMK